MDELSLVLDRIPYENLYTPTSTHPTRGNIASRNLIYGKLAPTIIAGVICITIFAGSMRSANISLQIPQRPGTNQETRQYNFSEPPFYIAGKMVPNSPLELLMPQERDFETEVLGTITNTEEDQDAMALKARINKLRMIPFTISSIVFFVIFSFSIISIYRIIVLGYGMLSPFNSYMLALASFSLLLTSIAGLLYRRSCNA